MYYNMYSWHCYHTKNVGDTIKGFSLFKAIAQVLTQLSRSSTFTKAYSIGIAIALLYLKIIFCKMQVVIF